MNTLYMVSYGSKAGWYLEYGLGNEVVFDFYWKDHNPFTK